MYLIAIPTDRHVHEASRGLFATAGLLVYLPILFNLYFYSLTTDRRYGYLPVALKMYVVFIVDNMESKLFNCILSNPRHLLYQLLPPEKDRPTGYNLRQRSESHHLISTYCIVYTLFAGLFTKLVFIFVLIFMLLSLSAFVRFLLKKLLA